MKKKILISLAFLAVLLVAGDVFAAAIKNRIQQQRAMQMQQQQQMVQQYQQQVMAQQQQQQQQAYQQAIAQQQAAMYQQAVAQKAAAEYMAYKQAAQQVMAQKQAQAVQVQQAVAQKQAQEAGLYQQAQQAVAYKQAVQQKQGQEVMAYKQAVGQKQMGEVVAYRQAMQTKAVVEANKQAQLNGEIKQYADFLAKRKAALSVQTAQAQQVATAKGLLDNAAQQKVMAVKNRVQAESAVQQDLARRQLGAQTAAAVMGAGDAGKDLSDKANEPEVVVDISELWTALDKSSAPWLQIMDDEVKLLTVAEYIDRFRRNGVKITRPPGEYMHKIDAIMRNIPEIIDTPFSNLLSYAAVSDYDFDNGRNKDELARQMLGEANFQANKKHLEGK